MAGSGRGPAGGQFLADSGQTPGPGHPFLLRDIFEGHAGVVDPHWIKNDEVVDDIKTYSGVRSVSRAR